MRVNPHAIGVVSDAALSNRCLGKRPFRAILSSFLPQRPIFGIGCGKGYTKPDFYSERGHGQLLRRQATRSFFGFSSNPSRSSWVTPEHSAVPSRFCYAALRHG